ncbi:TetR/AcrR family transcriptional regulator [Methylobacterium sp. NEAU 140]|uniref:TetR/AcrR family transcriptional regulator n=1 Tax=Methylobacterium sp. NEAU 140 TaxID=3064945 RepID=UPI002732A84B|nr:TetR/AcrR family transcriptional regulator [Methylobacterium sp. NEAU 140]MDP4024667.1 TetR/AcrR family transcriptional regulator [Methylobacterium sp. NEAU 140]
MNVVPKKLGRPSKSDRTRDEERFALARIALELIERGGLEALTARAVAERAGLSVGAIYKAFGDLEALRIEANAITMGDLRRVLEASLARSAGASATERLVALADAYAGFARMRRNAWTAMLAPRVSDAPPEIASEIAALFGLIGRVLEDTGRIPAAEIPVAVKALWASVHGMVHLGETNGLGPISPDDVPRMTRLLVTAALRGLMGDDNPAERNVAEG